MKNFIFFILIVFLQLLIVARPKPINEENNEDKHLFKFTIEMEKYQNVILLEAYNNEISSLIIDATTLQKRMISKPDNPSAVYFKNQLNEFETVIYGALEKICNVKPVTTFKVEIINLESFNIKTSDNLPTLIARPIGAFMRDNQQYWWIHSCEGETFPKEENSIVSKVILEIKSDYTIDDINKKNDLVLKAAQIIADAANEKPTMYEKLLYIHDYLITNIKYTDGEGSVYHNLYGALVNKQCVCGAYGEAFAYVSRLVGAEVIGVNSYNHGWDFVKMGSEWYVVDVTFDDDAIHEIGDGSNISYLYFLIGSETVVSDDGNRYKDDRETRTLSNSIEVPNATGFKYPTLSRTKYTEKSNKECWSLLKGGFPCCEDENSELVLFDGITGDEWGIENDNWCGITEKQHDSKRKCKVDKKYTCCDDERTPIIYVNKDNGEEWGKENGDWCGITDKQRNYKRNCPEYEQFKCCEKECNVEYTDDFKWGIEYGEWCLIPDSCNS